LILLPVKLFLRKKNQGLCLELNLQRGMLAVFITEQSKCAACILCSSCCAVHFLFQVEFRPCLSFFSVSHSCFLWIL